MRTPLSALKATLACLVLTCLCFTAQPLKAEPSKATEGELKTAFLYHLFNFTTWPQQSDNWRICVWPEYENMKNLQLLEQKTFNDKAIEISECTNTTCHDGCHMLLLPNKGTSTLHAFLNKIHTHSLIITDQESEMAKESMIRFFRDGRQIKMEINYRKTQQAGIKISSRLLRLMKIVDPESKDQP